jgi:two-component system, sensor histidine kinase PdtaS
MNNRGDLEDRFRQVVEAAPNAMIMIDMNGRVEMVNTQAEEVFGYTRNEILGQPVDMLVPKRFLDHDETCGGPISAGSRSSRIGARRGVYARRKDGSEFPVEIGLSPIETEDGPRILSAIVDISHLKQEQERIQAALREKEILLGEIHHRVKNNLQIVYSLLDLQSSRITDQAALDMLRDSRSRIQSMALIHQTLHGSNDFSKVDFARFVETLLPSLIGSYGIDANRIAIAVDVEPVRLPIDTAVPCGLVVNELITNAVKHAFRDRDRGEINIALARRGGDEIVLSVSDNGIGLPDTFDPERTETLGLRLVSLLAGQLDGTVAIHRADPTRFSMRFPIWRRTGVLA